MIRETDIERRLTRAVTKAGGLSLKLISPGRSGVPDRLLVLPGGRVIFAELKTRQGRPTPLQLHWRDRLRGLGVKSVIIRGDEELEAFLREEVMTDEVHSA